MKHIGLIRTYHSWLVSASRLLDLLVVAASLYISTLLWNVPWNAYYTVAMILAMLLTILVMHAVGLHRSWRGSHIFNEFGTIFAGWAIASVILLIIAFLTKSSTVYSRSVMITWFFITPCGLCAYHWLMRMVLRSLRKHGYNSRTAVIVGTGEIGARLARSIQSAEWMGIMLLGFFDNEPSGTDREIEGFKVLGSLEDIAGYINEGEVDIVYLAFSLLDQEKIKQVTDILQDTHVSVFLVPDLFVFDMLVARWQDIDGVPVISICESPFSGPSGFVKRAEDIILSTLILLLISPLMLVIAIAVKLNTPGPAIFKQRRYGLDGQEIIIWKFRSMTVCEDGESVPQAQKCDPRVTPLGRILRRTSLDELPQFVNVLQGNMSIVGPRAHPVAHNEAYRKLIKSYMWRHKVKPGITGWAQVNGWRGETDTLDKMEMRVKYDLEYIRHWSLWLDLKIILLTVLKGFTGENAY
jgi:putative colanic acid biosynthesis UDP-glucose lipid carrier transferase